MSAAQYASSIFTSLFPYSPACPCPSPPLSPDVNLETTMVELHDLPHLLPSLLSQDESEMGSGVS